MSYLKILLLLMISVVAWPHSLVAVEQQEDVYAGNSAALLEVGRAESLRAEKKSTQARASLSKAITNVRAKSNALRRGLREYYAWRLLPLEKDDLGEFKAKVQLIDESKVQGQAATSAWAGIFELYAAALGDDSEQLLKCAKLEILPSQFPTVIAEEAHWKWLQKQGLNRGAAGLQVIIHRDFEPLFALRNLDHLLTHKASLLEYAKKESAALALQKCRDRLRGCYKKIARHVVEKLFALSISGEAEAFAELEAKTRKLPYLAQPELLDALFSRLSEAQVWQYVVEPLMKHEAAFVEASPKLLEIARNNTIALLIRADKDQPQKGRDTYNGKVKIVIGHLEISCDRCDVEDAEKNEIKETILTGSGNVQIKGIPGFDNGISAGKFRFELGSGLIELSEKVILRGNEGEQKFKSCTIGTDGAVKESQG